MEAGALTFAFTLSNFSENRIFIEIKSIEEIIIVGFSEAPIAMIIQRHQLYSACRQISARDSSPISARDSFPPGVGLVLSSDPPVLIPSVLRYMANNKSLKCTVAPILHEETNHLRYIRHNKTKL